MPTDEIAVNTTPTAPRAAAYAGIAFLWFLGVLRDYIGNREDRFFSTLVLGSGLLFIAMLFTVS